MLKKLKYFLLMFKLRKEAKYIYETGKIPVCGCKDFLKTGNCKHIEEARILIKKFIG